MSWPRSTLSKVLCFEPGSVISCSWILLPAMAIIFASTGCFASDESVALSVFSFSVKLTLPLSLADKVRRTAAGFWLFSSGEGSIILNSIPGAIWVT